MSWVDRDPTDTARGPRQTPGDISIFDLECISGSLSVKLPKELHQITGYTQVYEAQILAVEKVRGKEEYPGQTTEHNQAFDMNLLSKQCCYACKE